MTSPVLAQRTFDSLQEMHVPMPDANIKVVGARPIYEDGIAQQ